MSSIILHNYTLSKWTSWIALQTILDVAASETVDTIAQEVKTAINQHYSLYSLPEI